MSAESWDEIRTAYHVAKAGTVSAAAEALGVHHATVIRHVDALEEWLGVKLFQRHARGYTPTEAGRELMQVAAATDEQLAQLVGRLRGRGEDVCGELVITTVNGLAGLLTPALARFGRRYPDVSVRYLTASRLFRLEFGEAHLAIRGGERPQEPDNVVQPFIRLRWRLCASRDYINEHGMPEGEDELARHRFVSADEEASRAPVVRWMKENLPPEAVVFRASEAAAVEMAVRAGAGIGFIAEWKLAHCPELVPLLEPREEWAVPLWLVTHVDLHRTAKVQAITRFLKEEARAWG